MDIVSILRDGTASELREIGELFLNLADSPRDAGWQALLDASLAKFGGSQDFDLCRAIDAARKRVIASNRTFEADGMGHLQLIDAELRRRGDARTAAEYVDAAGSPSGFTDD